MSAIAASRRSHRLFSPPLLLALAYAVLSVAWILGNPAGSAPDEVGHYLKALAVGAGDVAGHRVPLRPLPSDDKKRTWFKRTTRAVGVPPGLSPIGLDCNGGAPTVSAACQDSIRPPTVPTMSLTQIGTAQPTTYLVPGILARFGHDPVTAIRLGRLGGAITSIGLLWVAIALLWEPSTGAASLVGLVLTVTPMTIFLASSLTSSGPEAAAGICFFSALLRVTRAVPRRAWPWVALAVSGALLAASRTLGPLWVLLLVLVVVLAYGVGRSWTLVRAARRRALWSFGAVALVAALGLGWELAVQPHSALSASAVREALGPSVNDLDRVFVGELVGVFGSLDSPLPTWMYACWWGMLALLGVLALWRGSWRERVVLLVVALSAVTITLFVAMVNLAQTGFGMQGRYVLPVLVAGPLFAGEVVARRDRDPHGHHIDQLIVPISLVTGVVHALAWYANARRSAVGTDGSWLFIGSSEWVPETGWYPLLVIALTAVVLFALFAVVSVRYPAGAVGADAAATTRSATAGSAARWRWR